jgi:hypothetical protein
MKSSAAAIPVMIILTGTRNITRPQKKKSSDACRRRGIISTTRCIRNLFNPKYIYEKMRARMRGSECMSAR